MIQAWVREDRLKFWPVWSSSDAIGGTGNGHKVYQRLTLFRQGFILFLHSVQTQTCINRWFFQLTTRTRLVLQHFHTHTLNSGHDTVPCIPVDEGMQLFHIHGGLQNWYKFQLLLIYSWSSKDRCWWVFCIAFWDKYLKQEDQKRTVLQVLTCLSLQLGAAVSGDCLYRVPASQ